MVAVIVPLIVLIVPVVLVSNGSSGLVVVIAYKRRVFVIELACISANISGNGTNGDSPSGSSSKTNVLV